MNDKQSGEPGGLSVVVIDLVLIDTRRPQIVAATTWGEKKITNFNSNCLDEFFFLYYYYTCSTFLLTFPAPPHHLPLCGWCWLWLIMLMNGSAEGAPSAFHNLSPLSLLFIITKPRRRCRILLKSSCMLDLSCGFVSLLNTERTFSLSVMCWYLDRNFMSVKNEMQIVVLGFYSGICACVIISHPTL